MKENEKGDGGQGMYSDEDVATYVNLHLKVFASRNYPPA
jgi:hypothetical protein